MRTLLPLLMTLCAFSANTQPCAHLGHYREAMQRADSSLQAGEYRLAYAYLRKAEAFCQDSANVVETAVKDLLYELEQRRKQWAAQAREAQQTEARLRRALHFFDGKIARAHEDGAFFFVGPDGNPLQQLGQWPAATYFQDNGLCRVVNEAGQHLLMDTLGQTYPVAYHPDSLRGWHTAVDLRSFPLDSFPEKLLQQDQLQIVLLEGQRVPQQLPEEIRQLQRLRILSVRHFGLQQLPEGLTELQSLRMLDLHGNALKNIPPGIAQLQQLYHLNLSRNQLESLPKEIGELKQLHTLELWHNQLQQLPEPIGQLRQLQHLSVFANRLRQLPASIAQLHQLTELDLWHNKLEAFPEQLAFMPALRQVDLSHNGPIDLSSFGRFTAKAPRQLLFSDNSSRKNTDPGLLLVLLSRQQAEVEDLKALPSVKEVDWRPE